LIFLNVAIVKILVRFFFLIFKGVLRIFLLLLVNDYKN